MCPESGKMATSKFWQCCLYFSACSGLSSASSAPPIRRIEDFIASSLSQRSISVESRSSPRIPLIRLGTWDAGQDSLGGLALRQVLDAEQRRRSSRLLRETSP